MKVLIMVLSNENNPYNLMYQEQLKTWNSIEVDGVKTLFYFANEYNMMHYVFKRALDYVWDSEWDVIFRTNSSSYVDKELLMDYIKDKPKEKLLIGETSGILSGAGFFISRDLADIVRNKLDEYPNDSEDSLIASILEKEGYKPLAGKRVQYNYDTHKIEKCYHYRCKHETDRSQELIAFNNIFNKTCF